MSKTRVIRQPRRRGREVAVDVARRVNSEGLSTGADEVGQTALCSSTQLHDLRTEGADVDLVIDIGPRRHPTGEVHGGTTCGPERSRRVGRAMTTPTDRNDLAPGRKLVDSGCEFTNGNIDRPGNCPRLKLLGLANIDHDGLEVRPDQLGEFLTRHRRIHLVSRPPYVAIRFDVEQGRVTRGQVLLTQDSLLQLERPRS